MTTQPITPEHLLEQLKRLGPSALERAASYIDTLARAEERLSGDLPTGDRFTAFGIWADRPETQDSAAFAASLRQRLERGEDRRDDETG